MGVSDLRAPHKASEQEESPQSAFADNETKRSAGSQPTTAPLVEDEHVYRTIFESASDAIAIIALDGVIVSVNRSAERLTGFARDQIIGRPFTEFLTPESLAFGQERLQRALAGEALPSSFELVLRHAVGHTVSIEARTRFLRTPDGTITGFVGIYRDITTRKQAEEALRQSEERYRDLFENAYDMITTLALDGTFLSVNRKTEQLLGYTREEMIGQDSHKFATPESAAAGDERTRRVLAGEPVPSTFELDLIRKDGTVFPVEARIRFIRDATGKPVGFHGIYRDVTERKRAEEALRKAYDEMEDRVRERTRELRQANAALQAEVIERQRTAQLARAAEAEYRSIFENASEGIYRSSIDGRQLRANPALVKLNGYNSEAEQIAAVNNIATEWYVDPHRRAEFQKLLAQHRAVENFESEVYRHKTRERIWISENARLVQDKEGRPLYYEGTVQDITARKHAEEALRRTHAELEDRVRERTAALTQANQALQAEIEQHKRTEEALRESDDRYRDLFENATDAIGTTAPDMTIISLNRRAEEILGYPREEILGKRLEEFVTPESRHILQERRRQRKIGAPVAATMEVELVRKDQSIVSVEGRVRPLYDRQGQLLGIHGIYRDITERKKVERVKDELISTVSHELRTPLTSLRGFTELMLKREFPPDKQREMLAIIQRESVRLTHLIDDFLDLQRIERGHSLYKIVSVPLESILLDVAEVFTKELQSHTLQLDIASSLPAVRADANRLRQVVANLLSNAIKFSPQGGKIVIGARTDTHKATVWVQDHGIGIPQEAIPKLFTKFFRVDNSDTRHIGGTGLGLALVKEIITVHQGDIWVDSAVGQGTTFSFTLPHATEDE